MDTSTACNGVTSKSIELPKEQEIKPHSDLTAK